MKNKIIIILIALCSSAGIGGYLYYRNYKHNYIDTVTSYIKIEYTGPVEDPFYDTYGAFEMSTRERFSKPKFEFSFANFENDSIAVESTYQECKRLYDGVLEKKSKLEPEYTPQMSDIKREVETSKYQAKYNALNELLHQCTYLISFTHARKFDKKNMLKDLIKIGFDKEKLDKYMKKNKMSFKWYNVFVV